MIKYRCLNKKGQAVIEMAVFGGILLMMVGTLIGFFQQLNDRQYTQMEAFRRALEKGCNFVPSTDDGAGASVSVSLLQDRHYVNLTGGFKQGNTSRVSASSSVYWAVPKVEKDVQPDSVMVFRVNEDEAQINQKDILGDGHNRYNDDGDPNPTYWSLDTSGISSDSELNFKENNVKQEIREEESVDPKIINTRRSTFEEKIHTIIPYKVVEKSNSDSDYEAPVSGMSGTIADLNQGAYRDAGDGQYKYSTTTVGNKINRGRQWETGS